MQPKCRHYEPEGERSDAAGINADQSSWTEFRGAQDGERGVVGMRSGRRSAEHHKVQLLEAATRQVRGRRVPIPWPGSPPAEVDLAPGARVPAAALSRASTRSDFGLDTLVKPP